MLGTQGSFKNKSGVGIDAEDLLRNSIGTDKLPLQHPITSFHKAAAKNPDYSKSAAHSFSMLTMTQAKQIKTKRGSSYGDELSRQSKNEIDWRKVS